MDSKRKHTNWLVDVEEDSQILGDCKADVSRGSENGKKASFGMKHGLRWDVLRIF